MPLCKSLIRSATATAFLAAILLIPAAANAQTASRLNSKSSPESILWVSPPSEISQIRQLLQNGENAKALELARNFAEHLRTTAEAGFGGGGPTSFEYDATNALCVALSVNGILDEALGECNRAISMRSGDWRAYNSRGTVHYLAGRYEQALADYEKALEEQDQRNSSREIVEHNIALAKERLGRS